MLPFCCQFISTFGSFGRYTLIFVKNFLQVYLSFLPFQVLSFCSPSQTAVTSVPRMSGPQFTQSQCTGLLCLGEMQSLITSCNQNTNAL